MVTATFPGRAISISRFLPGRPVFPWAVRPGKVDADPIHPPPDRTGSGPVIMGGCDYPWAVGKWIGGIPPGRKSGGIPESHAVAVSNPSSKMRGSALERADSGPRLSTATANPSGRSPQGGHDGPGFWGRAGADDAGRNRSGVIRDGSRDNCREEGAKSGVEVPDHLRGGPSGAGTPAGTGSDASAMMRRPCRAGRSERVPARPAGASFRSGRCRPGRYPARVGPRAGAGISRRRAGCSRR